MAVMRHSAVFSLMAVGVSVMALLYVDGRNDRDLLAAQEKASQDLIKAQIRADHTHCEIASAATVATRSAFLRLAQGVPGESQVELDFVDWVKRCLVPQDCTQPTAAPPPLDEDCAVAPPVVATTIPGD